MARKQVTDMSAWPSLAIEGNLIAPAMVARLVGFEADEQTEESYGIRKGLTIREEISLAFRVGQSHFDAFTKLQHPSAEATRRFIRAFLNETFGFADFADGSGAIALIAGDRVPVVVVPPNEPLDRRSPTLSTDRSRSPAFALQDSLNDRDEVLWGLVTNGAQLRLMRDNASLTRPAYVEADLAQIFANEDAASFAALWLIIHRSRFSAPGAPATDCALERWREAGSREGEAARDRLAAQVEVALRVLGSGFLEANPGLAARLKSGELPLTEWFNELLRLVYRLIFLMVAEDRNLLHPERADSDARKLYAEGYSLAALRARCVRSASWDRYHDRYEGMKIVFRALAHGEAGLALPALGGLFADDRLPSLDGAHLRNRAFMEAVYRLSWLSDKLGMVPVNWRAMETEELGSVYESLLELQPQLSEDGRELVFASEATEQKGNQRKTTGSYYTPDSLVQAVLDTALDPVLDRTETEADDPATALLKLSVIDPACGSGHFLLAAARRIATRLARIRAEGTPSLADFRHALRDVARACIHGVDRNPMAVELTKVALWIETVDPGLPLGFFDAQIRCGDALLGVFDLKALEEGIPDAAYKPLTGDDKTVARYYAAKNRREKAERDQIASGFGFNRQRDLTREFAALRVMPENTLAEIEAKAARLTALTGQGAASYALARACDLYVTAFLAPKITVPQTAGPDGLPRRGAETVPTSGTVWELLRGMQPYGLLVQEAERALDGVRAFHWPLEFPDVIGRGGFDAVVGNPPWEVMQLSETEYFASRKPEIAVLAGAARKKAIEGLEQSDPDAFRDFVVAKRQFDASNEFARESGRFDLTARGKVNTYSLFAELFSGLAGSNGRAGVIVPTGIATDASTAPFFAALVESKRLARLVDFENRAKLFPAVDSRMKFCLLTLGQNEGEARFAFFLTDPAQLGDPERNFTLSPEQIAAINPNTRTAPVFRSRWDAELTAQMFRKSSIFILEGEDGRNPWSVDFHTRLWNMGEDAEHFSLLSEIEAGRFSNGHQHSGFTRGPTELGLPILRFAKPNEDQTPLFEAKTFHQFDHRWVTYPGGGNVSSLSPEQVKREPTFEPEPRYWVSFQEMERRLETQAWPFSWLVALREITNATNERTVIASYLPRTAVSHTATLVFPRIASEQVPCLLANLNSLALDFCARQLIGGTHLTLSLIRQLPVFAPSFYTLPRRDFIVPRILELTYTSHSLAPFARDLAFDGPPFAWDEDRRAYLRAELDAFYARAYGLSRDELRYILDPADMKGPDYPSETFRVLKEKEIRQYGEYRTRRLVLEAWDRMETDATFTDLRLGADAVEKPAAPVMQRPVLADLPDRAWERSSPQASDAGASLTAILKAIDGPTPSRDVRLATVMMLEPHLLTSLLTDDEAREWRRLIGREAEPRSGNVIGFAARTNQGWGTAVANHRGNGRLIEDMAAGTWAPGSGLDAFDTSGWPDGRAGFVLETVGAMDLETAVTSMPDEIRGWIRDAAAA
ncbi:Eco57I restriction-modification methylase domain-containing protein [Pseudaminobacter sp. NGMCC 1.201702]|uniref:Eco57I restriction-modification methylase domain-containing protein n=1 Tax=Pseudaminobacter sp. NGMCC 1.201702 TaxID=3391825 RepID=UPI0039EE6E60